MRYALATDRGQVREENQDCAEAVPELGLFVVADGMGGHVGGEVASRVAVAATIASVRSQPAARLARDECLVMETAALAANLAVVEEAERRELHGMGTTLTALRMHGRSAIVVNVGDTRAYVVTQNGMRALTTDQTVVATMIARGMITPEQAEHHPNRHVLTQALGTRDPIEPEIVQTVMRPGSRLLLSSDGLHGVVPECRIAELAAGDDLDAAVKALIEQTKSLGAPDNVTVLIVEP